MSGPGEKVRKGHSTPDPQLSRGLKRKVIGGLSCGLEEERRLSSAQVASLRHREVAIALSEQPRTAPCLVHIAERANG